MSRIRPVALILTGFVLLLGGWLVSFLMVLQIVDPSFFLAFLAFCAFTIGLVIGLLGTMFFVMESRK